MKFIFLYLRYMYFLTFCLSQQYHIIQLLMTRAMAILCNMACVSPVLRATDPTLEPADLDKAANTGQRKTGCCCCCCFCFSSSPPSSSPGLPLLLVRTSTTSSFLATVLCPTSICLCTGGKRSWNSTFGKEKVALPVVVVTCPLQHDSRQPGARLLPIDRLLILSSIRFFPRPRRNKSGNKNTNSQNSLVPTIKADDRMST